MGFETPSPVQEASIEPMLSGQDLMVQAPTGTGKTAAFGIPIVENTDVGCKNAQTVILCPTRELALQIADVLKQLSVYKPGVRVLALYGGDPIQRQITALRRKPQIIVATPGRMIDHIRRRTIRLSSVSCVVLDEADRMLDMGFRDDIDTILQSVPDKRQTVLFSATLSDGIKRIAATYQNDVKSIQIQQKTKTVEQVAQHYCEVRGNAKTAALLHLLKEETFKLPLVFVSTKRMADALAAQLSESGLSAEALHGDMRQSQRNKVIGKYRTGKVGVLVATDVAARGIDVDGIDVVINYDIPGDSDSYVHRIGRTGRAGKTGVAYTFIYPKERGKLREIIADTKAAILPVDLGLAVNTAFVPMPQTKRSDRTAPKNFYGKPSSGRSSYGRRSDEKNADKKGSFKKRPAKKSYAGKDTHKQSSWKQGKQTLQAGA